MTLRPAVGFKIDSWDSRQADSAMMQLRAPGWETSKQETNIRYTRDNGPKGMPRGMSDIIRMAWIACQSELRSYSPV